MKSYKKWATAGVALSIVGVVAGCGQSPSGTATKMTNSATTNAVLNNTNASTPATNSSVITNTTTNNTSGNSTVTNSPSSTTPVQMKTFAVGNRFSVDIPVDAQQTGPHPTDNDAYFWAYKKCKISISTNYNPIHQSLKSTLTGYSKGLTISSTSQGKDWFQLIGTQQKNGVTQKLMTKGYIGQMIQTVTISYPQSQSSQYDVLAQSIISSFHAKTV